MRVSTKQALGPDTAPWRDAFLGGAIGGSSEAVSASTTPAR
jgi:hypothetical protein